jgi:hypothetical protein
MPSGSVNEVLRRALHLLITQLEKKKFAATGPAMAGTARRRAHAISRRT